MDASLREDKTDPKLYRETQRASNERSVRPAGAQESSKKPRKDGKDSREGRENSGARASPPKKKARPKTQLECRFYIRIITLHAHQPPPPKHSCQLPFGIQHRCTNGPKSRTPQKGHTKIRTEGTKGSFGSLNRASGLRRSPQQLRSAPKKRQDCCKNRSEK